MNDFVRCTLSLMSGFVTGLFFFGGLWWTVRNGVKENRPGIFVVSFIIRFGVVGLVILAFRQDWKALLLLLGGFIAAKAVVVGKISTHVEP